MLTITESCKSGLLSREAAITLAVSSLGLSREDAEVIIQAGKLPEEEVKEDAGGKQFPKGNAARGKAH